MLLTICTAQTIAAKYAQPCVTGASAAATVSAPTSSNVYAALAFGEQTARWSVLAEVILLVLDMVFAVRQRSARANGDTRVTGASTDARISTDSHAAVRPPTR